MTSRPTINPYTRFLSHVDTKSFDPASCWPWKGAGKGNGYGNVRIGKTNLPAHRRSYELFVGEVPSGMDVCHTCDVRCCVNPDHLFVGTRTQNVDDARQKGRLSGGVRKHIREAEVQEIRRRLEAGLSPSRISQDTGVHYDTVQNIKKGVSYVGISK